MAYKPNRNFLKKQKKQMGGGDWWEPEKNVKNYFRVMPPWDKQGIVVFRRVLHYNLEEDGRARAFPCLEDNEPWLPSSPCPVCPVASGLMKGIEDEREAGKGLAAGSPRFVCQGVNCKNPELGVLKYSGPYSFGKYLTSLLEDDDLEDITDPEKGYDLIIEVSGKGRGTKYDYRIRPKPTPIIYEDWEEELSDLIGEIKIKSAPELIEIMKNTYSAFDIEKYLEDFESSSKAELTPDDIEKLSTKKLKKLIKEHNLDIEKEDWEDKEELIEIIIEELEENDLLVPF